MVYPYLREIMSFYKKHIKYYIGYVIILLIKAVIAFLNAMFVAKIISAMMESNFHQAFIWATVIVGMLTFGHILSWCNTFLYKALENNVKFDLQQAVVNSALNIKMIYYDAAGSGVIMTRLTSDIDHISERFKSLTEKIVNILRRIAYLVFIFFLNVYLGLLVLGCVIIVTLSYTVRIYYLKKMKPGVKRQQEQVNSRIIEIIRAIKDVKTLNCADSTLNLLGDEQKKYIKRDNVEWYVGSGLSHITSMLIDVSSYLFILVSILLMSKFNLTATVFYTCYLYKDHTFTLANEFGDFRYKLGECEVYAKRLYALLYPEEYNIDKFGTQYVKNYSGQIEFQNVHFSYMPEVPVLKGTSFTIEPKSTVAFVGESGSGKSTIIQLIAHLYYKQEGSILFDGVPIEELSKEFIKENVAVVNQFPYIFNLSIRENFQMIDTTITDEKIIELCKKVGLQEYIEKLPNGLDSVIGEGGCQLSGGQRQKLCIARALCRNVKIMIFDEATSSLDNTSQNEIMEVIENLKNEMTILLIAHRLSTITYADRIILMKEGCVVDHGRHEELLERSGYYQNLYNESK